METKRKNEEPYCPRCNVKMREMAHYEGHVCRSCGHIKWKKDESKEAK